MVAFTEEQTAKDADNLERVKDAVVLKAREGDLEAAAIFASLIDAQTRRAELLARDGVQPKAQAPATEQASLPWTEKVGASDTAPQLAVA
jgi:hypothetical protein